MRRARRLAIGGATVALIAVALFLWLRPNGGAIGTPVLRLLVDGAPSATVGAGSPFFLEVFLHGTGNAAGPSLGGRLRPWHRLIAIRATQNGREIALPFLEVAPPRVRALMISNDGRPSFSDGESAGAALDGVRRVFRMELAAAPDSTRQLSAGTYQLVASLETPIWQFWGWRGRAESALEGLATKGLVLTKDIRSSGRGSSRTEHYEASYRFVVSGETIEGRDELTKEDWERLTEREAADVLYLPREPWTNRLAGARPWLKTRLFGLLGLVFAVVGSMALVRSVRHARLQWHLRRHGFRGQGIVTELRDLNLKLNGQQQWRLRYEYRDVQGLCHVKTLDLPQGEAQTWTLGDAGDVLFDSMRPTDAVWLGRDQP